MPTATASTAARTTAIRLVVAAGLAAVQAYRAARLLRAHPRRRPSGCTRGLKPSSNKRGVPARVQGLGRAFRHLFRHRTRNPRLSRVLSISDDRCSASSSAAIDHGVYFHDYGGAACHHGFCAAMTLADVEEALARLERAIARQKT